MDPADDASGRESRLIAKYRDRIAGLNAFAGMEFVGLAWASSNDPGSPPYERYIDTLYRRSVRPIGYADVAVRTWLRAPLARVAFAAEPYLAPHVHDFMFERKGGDFDFEYGVAEITEALQRPGRSAGTLALGDIRAAQYRLGDVVTVVGFADNFPSPPSLAVGLSDIPRIRG
ncbi:hypothetical protein [Agromyces silvae]|uniref:hypothetical protein n=1 Tax=Agromyces silvae TaxID=3388266 RepID=UPI00280BFBAC|nr:hypothetical protein [Agromyces protaetiae]